MKQIFLVFTLFLLLLGCTRNVPLDPIIEGQPGAKERRFGIEHKVTFDGETLGQISAWYTGSVGNWKAIAKANDKLNPNRIQKGQIIKIPGNLVIKTTPLTKDFLAEGKRSVKNSVKGNEKGNEKKVPNPSAAPSTENKNVPSLESATPTPKPSVAPTFEEEELVPLEDEGNGENAPEAKEAKAAKEEKTLKIPVPEDSPPPATPVPARQKTRDDLLRELLEE